MLRLCRDRPDVAAAKRLDIDGSLSSLAPWKSRRRACRRPEPRFSPPNPLRRFSALWIRSICISRPEIALIGTKSPNHTTTAQYKPTEVAGILTTGLRQVQSHPIHPTTKGN